MIVRDAIDECHPIPTASRPPPSERKVPIDMIVVHRIRVPLGDTAAAISRYFTDPQYGFGWRVCPYTLLFLPDGRVEQAVPLGIVTPHAKTWNHQALGIGVIGEHELATPEQMLSLRRVLRVLVPLYGSHGLAGHTKLPYASGDRVKVCPAPVIDMLDLCTTVYTDIDADRAAAVSPLGLVV